MKRRIGFGAELTLLELLIVIGLFAVFAAFDIRIFAAAQRCIAESDRLTHAVIAAESAAECFKAGRAPVLYYDEYWQPTNERSAAYTVSVDAASHGGVRTAQISVSDNSHNIFALTAKSPEVSP